MISENIWPFAKKIIQPHGHLTEPLKQETGNRNSFQIIPHDISRRMAGGRTINVYVTVQGNVIGNAQYANSLGNLIAQKVLRAMDNT